MNQPSAPGRATAAESSVFHRTLREDLPVAVRGEGIHIVWAGGRRVIDACGGAAVSCLGHGHPAVREAIIAQLDRLAFAYSSFFTTEPAERLAAALLARAPSGFGRGRAMLLGSGSEAMEAALKLARQFHLERGEPRRDRFIARDLAYHGNTLGALAVGGHAARRAPYAPLLMEVGRVPACHAYRGASSGESLADYGTRMAAALEAEIIRLGPDRVAAFVAEPVCGATLGCVPPPPGYFAAVRAICDRYGVLLIADEVMCGSGRTGTWHALEQEGVAADIVTIAKGLGGGFQPIAATLASGRVAQAVEAGSGLLVHGHTYMSHAVASAAALAVLDIVDREDLLAAVRARGADLFAALERRFGAHAHVGDIRGRGLFAALEFVADRASRRPFPPEVRLAARIKAAAFEAGLMVYPGSGCVDGVAGDHILLAPPYIVTPSQIETIVERLGHALDSVLAAVPAV